MALTLLQVVIVLALPALCLRVALALAKRTLTANSQPEQCDVRTHEQCATYVAGCFCALLGGTTLALIMAHHMWYGPAFLVGDSVITHTPQSFTGAYLYVIKNLFATVNLFADAWGIYPSASYGFWLDGANPLDAAVGALYLLAALVIPLTFAALLIFRAGRSIRGATAARGTLT